MMKSGTNFLNTLYVFLIWASLLENMILLHTNIKGGDQPAHMCNLICIFIIRSLKSIIANLGIYDISMGESSNFPKS